MWNTDRTYSLAQRFNVFFVRGIFLSPRAGWDEMNATSRSTFFFFAWNPHVGGVRLLSQTVLRHVLEITHGPGATGSSTQGVQS